MIQRIVVAAVLATSIARAQSPEGSAKLSAGAVADSLVVLKQLDSAIAANPRDASSWYRRGMIAWALYERDRTKPPISGLDWTKLGRMADTSLRIASDIEPDNGQYRLMVGRYLLLSGVSITRLASYGMFEAALEAARKDTDRRVLSETAVEAGRVNWRRYDAIAHRVVPTGDDLSDLESEDLPFGYAGRRAALARDDLRLHTMTMDNPREFMGEIDYIQAEALFREAFDADRTYERAYRQLAMLLVERNRWQELTAVARARIDAMPSDAWAWLTLGLAMQRADISNKNAASAFERGISLLSPDERERLDNIERLLKPADSTRFANLDSATRVRVEKLYWTNADPLLSREGNEIRAEFLARVTYAELRWTVEEMRVRGAETDRGNVHIRYGPPDVLYALKSPDSAAVYTHWVYDAGLHFKFRGMVTFATAAFPSRNAGQYVDLMISLPSRWDNVRHIRIDSIPVQVARFRGGEDSVDVYVATEPPITRIKEAAEVGGNVRTDFWMLNGLVETVVHDSSSAAAPGIKTYVHRVPRGGYMYRTEATADGSVYAGRALAAIDAGTDTSSFRTSGFGMSDVLMAGTVTSRGNPQRWNELNIRPIMTTVVRRGEFALVWENYELGDERGSAKYQVAVTIDRQRSLAGRIAASIVGRVGSAVGIDRQPDRVTIHYERNVAHAKTILDNVALKLDETPAGTYVVTVAVLDHTTGRTMSRSMTLTVAEK